MVIDPHVHFRDFKEAYKQTVKKGLEEARDSGVSAAYDMLNTDPPGTEEEVLMQRFKLAEDADVKEVVYGVYVIATPDREQVRRAVQLYRKHNLGHRRPGVAGIKMYAGHSVNRLGVILLDDQFGVVETATQEGFDGVLAVHPEKQDYIKDELWVPGAPITHSCVVRPEKSEIESVKDMIAIAYMTGFKGTLHIAHISSPSSVELVKRARRQGMRITCGVTPHHLFYDWTQMAGEDGLMWKMNPPLRKPGDPATMLEHLRNGDIDWIETDDAPHTDEDKRKRFASGIRGMLHWPMYKAILPQFGFSDQQVEAVTHDNVERAFGFEIPRNNRPIVDRRSTLTFNYHKPLEDRLRWSAS